MAVALTASAAESRLSQRTGRELAASLDEMLMRLDSAQATLDELAALERDRAERAAAQQAAERIARRLVAEREAAAAVAAEPTPAQPTASSGGVIRRGAETIVISPRPARKTKDPRGEPPAGYVWLFAHPADRSTTADLTLAPLDPEEMTDAEWDSRVRRSAARARLRFPFLAKKDDPRREQLDVFVEEREWRIDYATLFGLSCWPELAAAECAREFEW